VILDLHRQSLLAFLKRNAFRHCPRLQSAAQLEPKVVVQARGIMFLDDKTQRFIGCADFSLPRGSAVREKSRFLT
jgi:hypothetical protein